MYIVQLHTGEWLRVILSPYFFQSGLSLHSLESATDVQYNVLTKAYLTQNIRFL